ncbi:MAG: hypothetical protein AAB074_16970 [Planctomycetota bacterium]
MNPTTWTYLAYLTASIATTIWVARTLHKNGRIFLVDSFLQNEALADSVNHLLVVGFYLINVGYVCLALKYGDKPDTLVGAIESFSTRIGLVLLVLGVMHFFNIYVFSRMRRRAMLKHQPPPVAPDAIRNSKAPGVA